MQGWRVRVSRGQDSHATPCRGEDTDLSGGVVVGGADRGAVEEVDVLTLFDVKQNHC